jgi:hypothetical protein
MKMTRGLMGSTRFLPSCVGALAVLAIAACSDVPKPHELRVMGQQIEVVYFQPEANLAVWKLAPLSSDGLGCYPAGGLLGALLCSEYEKHFDWSTREAAVVHEGALAQHAVEVQALGFDAQAYSVFASVIAATGWLPDKRIKMLQGYIDEASYVRQSPGVTVVYVHPVFVMSLDNLEFLVYAVAGVQMLDTGYPRNVHDFRRREFTFTHQLRLAKPGMSWDPWKRPAYQAKFPDPDQALDIWLANDGAQLHADFADDMRQIDQGLREMLGTETKMPGS